MVLTAYTVLSPATNSSCHRHPRIKVLSKARSGRLASANLTPATGARTTRFCRPHMRRSSRTPLIAHEVQPACDCHCAGVRNAARDLDVRTEARLDKSGSLSSADRNLEHV